MKKKYNRKVLANATEKNSGRKIAIILGAFIVGCVCIIVSSFFSNPWKNYDNWRILINVGLSTLATVAFASVAWEGVAKYAFSRDVIDMVGISDSIKNSGVFAIESSFSSIEWDEILCNAKSITAVFTYSTKWGKDNREIILHAVQNACQFRVVLPNTAAPGVLDALNFRFSGVDNLNGKVGDAEQFYKSLGAEIGHYSKTIQCSYYLIDDIAVMVPFNHQKEYGGHTPSVPAFLASKPGHLYYYIATEVKAILDSSDLKSN